MKILLARCISEPSFSHCSWTSSYSRCPCAAVTCGFFFPGAEKLATSCVRQAAVAEGSSHLFALKYSKSPLWLVQKAPVEMMGRVCVVGLQLMDVGDAGSVYH